MQDITAQTTKFYKEIQKMMRVAGYKYKRSVASACEDLKWTKGDHAIEISGWHGQQNWSNSRVVLTAYESSDCLTVLAKLVHSANDIDSDHNLTASAQAVYPNQLRALKAQIKLKLK